MALGLFHGQLVDRFRITVPELGHLTKHHVGRATGRPAKGNIDRGPVLDLVGGVPDGMRVQRGPWNGPAATAYMNPIAEHELEIDVAIEQDRRTLTLEHVLIVERFELNELVVRSGEYALGRPKPANMQYLESGLACAAAVPRSCR